MAGSEFLLPVRGFYCLLCKEFYGDAICAEEHVTKHAHNEKYKKLMQENPLYEQRRNLDRQAGTKRKLDETESKSESKFESKAESKIESKHKKDKKTREESEEKNGKNISEEELSKKTEIKTETRAEIKIEVKNQDQDRPFYKKDEDEKLKLTKKEEKYRYREEEDRRDKYKREDEERFKYGKDDEYRHRTRRYDDDRYEDRPKYGLRDEDRPKYGYRDEDRKPSKYLDPKSKYDRDLKKPEPKKGPELPPRPFDPPKIYCGPSPAMRAKLKKQNQDKSGLSPVATATAATFGKFTWKKKENVLMKEAQKVAAAFIKDDEAAAEKQKLHLDEDPFAKSVAAAKEIAEKLAQAPPAWATNRGRIRPNLPVPAAGPRRGALSGKPAPHDTFLSMRNETQMKTEPSVPLPASDPNGSTLNMQPDQNLERKLAITAATEATTYPTFAKLATVEPKRPIYPPPAVPHFAPQISSPIVHSLTPVPPNVLSLNPPKPLVNPSPPVSKPLFGSNMVKIVSDVAAPGVPLSEQTQTVYVKPPPFMNSGHGAQKAEKFNTSLAAAKAKDLFGIFYSSTGQTGPSFTKPVAKPEPKTPVVTQVTTQPAPQSEQTVPESAQHPDKLQEEPGLQITSVWSLHNLGADSSQTSPRNEKNQSSNQVSTSQNVAEVVPENKTQNELRKEALDVQTQAQSLSQNQASAEQSLPQNEPKNVPEEDSVSQSLVGNQLQKEAKVVQSFQEIEALVAESRAQNFQEVETASFQILSEDKPQSEPESEKPTAAPLTQSRPQLEATVTVPLVRIVPENKSEAQNQAQSPPRVQPTAPQIEQESPTQTEVQHPDSGQNLEPLHSPPEPKPGPKTRGKKKASPKARPVRQTRYQTRRSQQHNPDPEPEPEPEPEPCPQPEQGLELELAQSQDQGASVQKEVLEAGLQPEDEVPIMELTPETLGLPSDMTSLDFDYDFNFE